MHVLTTTSFIITNNCKLCSWRGDADFVIDGHSLNRTVINLDTENHRGLSLSQIEWQLGRNKVLSEKGLSTLGPLILKRNNERKKGAHPFFTKKQLGCPRLHKNLFLLQKY